MNDSKKRKEKRELAAWEADLKRKKKPNHHFSLDSATEPGCLQTPEFKAMGALDGGIDIPHSEKRFVGFNKDSKQLDPEVHRKYIYGGHVSSHLRTLMEDELEKYQSHFSEYIKRGIEVDRLERMYKKVYAAICADPATKKSGKPGEVEPQA